jgi:HEPN domain-containing protein
MGIHGPIILAKTPLRHKAKKHEFDQPRRCWYTNADIDGSEDYIMREEAQNWWEQAKHDLETADFLLEGDRLDAASFYYQQAIEKALKSLHLLSKKEPPGAVHSLTRIARDLDVPNEFLGFLRSLSGEYVLSRYPDVVGDVPYRTYSRDEVKARSGYAHEVFEWIEQQLKRF